MDIKPIRAAVFWREQFAEIGTALQADIDNCFGFIRTNQIIEVRLDGNAVVTIEHGELIVRPDLQIIDQAGTIF